MTAARIQIEVNPREFATRDAYDDATYDELVRRAEELSPSRVPIKLEVEYRSWDSGEFDEVWEETGDTVEVTWPNGEVLIVALPRAEVTP